MSAFGDVLKNILLFDPGQVYGRIYIVSAYGGVTNWLLEDKKTGAPGVYHHFIQQKDYSRSMQELTIRLKNLNRNYLELGLDLEAANAYIEQRMADALKYLEGLSDVLASGYLRAENLFSAAREILASIGESHSAFNAVNILQNMGYHATLVDLSGFNDAELLTIDKRIQKQFSGIDFSRTITVVTGYTKGIEGIMREFDRGYSEVTFSKVAVAVQAAEAIIHKEYHLSSADPNVVGVDKAVPVGFTNYDVADQLADIGMEAIHPKAAKPLEINQINLRIKNTFEPGHPGTLITKDYVSQEKRVEIITGTDKVVVIDIYDPLMVGSVGYDLRVMQDFAAHGISYIFKATSANNISVLIWEKDFSNALMETLKSKYDSVSQWKAAIVCLLGTNIDPTLVLAKSAQSLEELEIDIWSAGFSLRHVNVQLIIDRQHFREAVRALNGAFHAY